MTLTPHQHAALELLATEPTRARRVSTGSWVHAEIHPSTGYALARRGLATISFDSHVGPTWANLTPLGLKALVDHVDTSAMTTTDLFSLDVVRPWAVQRGSLLIFHRYEADALTTAGRLVDLGHAVTVYDRRDRVNTLTRLRPLELAR